MPKERRSSSCRCGTSPYSRGYKNDDKRTPKSQSRPIGNEKEYEEARCPICIEHPHNAVLLLCSSHEKGCRPYIGQINGWTVVKPAREFMNSKTRNCSLDTCDFAGNYSQLRVHARRVHPCVKPTDVDPEREHEWRIMQEDLEQQEMFNMQFEFDDADDADVIEYMEGVSDLASPIWDLDLDLINFITTFESDFESLFSEMDSGSDDTSLFLDDWDTIFNFPPSHESEIRESSRSRGAHNRMLGWSRENARATRSRTATHVRQMSNRRSYSQPRSNGQRSNSQLRSRNRQSR